MVFRIDKDGLSGDKCNIYSVWVDGAENSLFDNFINDYYDSYPDEVQDIFDRLKAIGSTVSAKEHFFKLNEGKPGDGVAALYDIPSKHLRLYCIRYWNSLIIIGGGGEKSRKIKAWQESDILAHHVNLMMRLSRLITKALKEKDMAISSQDEFIGTLTLDEDEY